MGRVAGGATSLLLDRHMRYLHSTQLFAYLDMALYTKIRHLLLEHFGNRRPVGIVTGGAGTLPHRHMDNLCFLQGFGKIGMAFQTLIPGCFVQ